MAGLSVIPDLDTIPVLLYAVVVLAVVWLLKVMWFGTHPADFPPLPERPWPFFGHMLKLQGDPRGTIAEWRRKAGDIFCFYIASKPMVVLCGYDILKEALVKRADQFTDRPHSLLNDRIDDARKGIVFTDLDNWKEQRSVTLSILRSFGMGKNSLSDKITEEVDAYLEQLSNLKGEAAEVRMLTTAAVSNVICSIIVGQRFEYDDPYFLEFLRLGEEQFRKSATVTLLIAYPWLSHLPGDPAGAKKLVEGLNVLNEYFSARFIKQQKAEEEDDGKSFITAYLKEMKRKKKNNEPTLMDESNLRRIIGNLFLAGSDTSSTTLLWFMLFMIRHPDIQRKVFTQIDEVVGTERTPSMHDKPKLNYLNAVIMETQRLGSIAPFSLQHLCTETVHLRGYTIAAGTTIIPNLDSVLLDEKIWGDPNNFRPERFLDADGNLLNPEEFVPFSLGRRMCLGESLTKMELLLFTSALIQRFELLPETEGDLPPTKAVFGLTAAPQPFKLRFRHRHA